MTFIAKPKFHHPKLPVNALGLTRRDYEGSISTLCAGCGHDSISAAIVQACAEMSLPPHIMAKMSGIGCSSKTPNYFLNKSHGFNSVHGRMPSIATGANLANRELVYVGVSGDGDTASIGIGQFTHAVRRQLNMMYMVENNGTYGLTKGQLSATTDIETRNKVGELNQFESIDLVSMAVMLGASFVARSFSGDKEQLVPLIKAAISHRGFALIDCISPCVTFNNHAGSTKSFDYVREHNAVLNRPDFVPHAEEITVSYKPGETREVRLHDGDIVALHKVAKDYDPTDRAGALDYLQRRQAEGKVVTGLVYVKPDAPDLHSIMQTVQRPLNQLGEAELCPGPDPLEAINAALR
ncbi:MAG: 2-oxoacid:ferredoxin oxidoreductase subunit beta [Gammaproteobacteria bacterium]|nr:2-oxoacid:ferredoxin oxidoreductase subunit beta [Gammaproteobacteria bacterium]